MTSELTKYRFGRCTVITSIENGFWHLSISTPDALPSYKEMKEARYKFCPEEIYMAEIFPPKSEFVNFHPFCRHLWQIDIDKSNYPKK
jgi:hypothetical protein